MSPSMNKGIGMGYVTVAENGALGKRYLYPNP
jgi:hypothetical protein